MTRAPSFTRMMRGAYLAVAVFLIWVGFMIWMVTAAPEPGFCQAERANTPEGVEVVYYPHGATPSQPGLEVVCPRRN